MSTRLRFQKDWKGYKKGQVVHVRHIEAQEAIRDKVAVVQTDMSAESYQSKDQSSDGNTQKLRTHKSRRR